MKKNIAIIFGSRSVEHEISIITANQVLNAIDKNKYNVIPVYISKEGNWYTGSVLEKVENFKNLGQNKESQFLTLWRVVPFEVPGLKYISFKAFWYVFKWLWVFNVCQPAN